MYDPSDDIMVYADFKPGRVPSMFYAQEEVMQFVREQDVRFVRLAFCDIFGQMKNISISASELPRAFSTGISFDASAVKGFLQVEESDLLLFPDPATLAVLPWRPAQGRVVRFFCDIRRPNGEAFEGDGRNLLRQAEHDATLAGYQIGVGPECEFYLFKRDQDGEPTDIPMDKAGYFDVAPLDKGENVRREICLTLEEMGFYTERSHHEHGPGQNEIDFKYSTALQAADNLITFKSAVKTIAARSGLFASFLPKPLSNESGSGLHINFSLTREGSYSERMEKAMLAGILRRIREMTVFLNPLVNSYERLGAHEAPLAVGWGHGNRSLLVRIPEASGEYRRIELRSPDPSCNPYLAFALLIRAAMEGISDNLSLQEEFTGDAYARTCEDPTARLPLSLTEAIELARGSEFIGSAIPRRIVESFLQEKEAEWKRCQAAENPADEAKRMFFIII